MSGWRVAPAPKTIRAVENRMQIILFRHGIAMEPADASAEGITEKQRPLTREGIERTDEAVLGLREVVKSIGLIAQSPLTRARQTADLIAAAYPSAQRAETRWLSPGLDAERLASWLVQQASKQRDLQVAVLVGHEPDLSSWATWAISGRSRPLFGLKKAGACSVLFEDGTPQAGKGMLQWLLTPAQLRRMGR